MKKLSFNLFIIVMLVFRINVFATNLNLELDCPNTAYSGDKIICNVVANTSVGAINGINANFKFENANILSFEPNSNWSIYNNSSKGFAIGNINGISGRNTIGKLNINIIGSSGDTVKIDFYNIGASDTEFNDVSVSNVSKKINVIERPTTTTKITVPKTTTTTTNKTTVPKTTTTTTTVNKTTVPKRTTKKHTTTSEVTTAPVNIEQTTTTPTTSIIEEKITLNDLTVEGYDIAFDKNKFEYTLEVSHKVQKLIISAKADPSYTITGVGEIFITDQENILIINVTKEDKKSTYTIKVNKLDKNSNVVENKIEEINSAYVNHNELIVNLNSESDNLIISQPVIDTIKNTDRKITYNIKKEEEILYYYEFNGNKFTDSYNDINLKLNFIKDEEVDKVINSKNKIVFENEHKSNFPEGTVLNVKNTSKIPKNKNIYIYEKNNDTELKLLKNDAKVINNYIGFEIDKGARYVLSNKKIGSNSLESISSISKIIMIIELLIIIFLLFKKYKIRIKEN